MSKSILIVEDDSITARYIELGLRRLGYSNVRLAASSDAALDLVRAEVPDLVLMDIQIDGERDGIDTAKLLRVEFNLPVIFLTGQTDELTVARAKQVEPLAYLVKPVKAEDLRTTIAVGLHKNRLEQEVRDRERIFAAVTSATHDIVVACDGERRICYVNPAAERFFGRDAASVIGKPMAEIMVAMSHPDGVDSAAMRVAGRDTQVTTELAKVDGVGEVLIVRPMNEKEPESAELRRLRAEFTLVATSDPITGLANRRGFLLIGEQQLQFARCVKAKLALLLIEVRGLERIEEEFGAAAVEQAARDVADTLRRMSGPGELLGHLAPNRYAVLLPLQVAARRASDLPAELAAHCATLGRAFELEISVDQQTLDTKVGGMLAAEVDRVLDANQKITPAVSARGVSRRRRPS